MRYSTGVSKRRKQAPRAGEQDAAALEDLKRMQLLHHEIDLLTAASIQRQESLANKASFLTVAAGVVLTGLTAQFWQTPPEFLILSVALTLVVLGLAAAALVPRRSAVLDGPRAFERFVDSKFNRASIERNILETKVANLRSRNDMTQRQAFFVMSGYWVLVVSALSFGVGVILHYLN